MTTLGPLTTCTRCWTPTRNGAYCETCERALQIRDGSRRMGMLG